MKPVDVARCRSRGRRGSAAGGGDARVPRRACSTGSRAALPDGRPRSPSTLDDGMDSVHLGLTVGRPWDLVLDVAGGKGAARRWAVLLHHVRRGGAVAVRLPGRPEPLERSVRRRAGRPGERPSRRRPRAATSAATPSATWPPWRRRPATSGSSTAGCARPTTSPPSPRCPSSRPTPSSPARPGAGRVLTTPAGSALRLACRRPGQRPRCGSPMRSTLRRCRCASTTT